MFLNDSQVRRRQEIGAAALARHAELGEDVLGRYIELRDPARVLMPGSVRVAEGGTRIVSGGSTVTVPADKYRIVETDDADLVATIKAPGWMFGNGERPDDAAEIKLEFVPVRVVDSDGRGCELSVEMLASAYAMEDAKTEKEKYEALSLYYQFEDGERVLDPDEVADMMLRGSAPVATSSERDLPTQDTTKPKFHVQGISKLSDSITDVKMGETVLLDMSGKREAQQSVLTSLCLTYDADGIEISRNIDPIDREIHNAVATLWAAGNRIVTPRQVYQVMTGTQSNPKPKAIEETAASIDKQRRTFVKIDYTDELRGRPVEFEGETVTPSQCSYETYMLNADKVDIKTANGSIVSGYIIKEAPILYRHDITTKQIVTYPQKLLEASSRAVKATDTNVLIRSYLIGRIKKMIRKGSKLSRSIRYDTMYEAIGKGGATRTERSRMNTTVKKLLDFFVGEGLIKGWHEYGDKGSNHKLGGVEIETADSQ